MATRTRSHHAPANPAPETRSRRHLVVVATLVVVVLLAGAFALGRLTGSEPSSANVQIERDMAGRVLEISQDGSAIVLETGPTGSMSYLLLGQAPAVGEIAQGTLVLLRIKGQDTVEAFVPRP